MPVRPSVGAATPDPRFVLNGLVLERRTGRHALIRR